MRKIFFVSFIFFASILIVSSSYTATSAILQLVEQFFMNRSISFVFIVNRNTQINVVNQILSRKPLEIASQIWKLQRVRRFSVHQSAILMFDDIESYYELFAVTSIANDYPKEFFFFVYIDEFNHEDIDRLIPSKTDPLHPLMLFKNTNFLLNFKNKNYMDLITFQTFNQPDCRRFTPVTINRFSKVTKHWESRNFVIEKFRNFNGCELVVMQFSPQDFYLTVVQNIVQETLNFKVKSVIIDWYSNTNLTEMIPHDFEMSANTLRTIEREGDQMFYTLTHHITVVEFFFLVSRSTPLSHIEKVLLPFDPEVWYGLIVVLLLSALVIVVVSFMRRQVRYFVFGLRVRSPLLNLM
jgi:hypothetical protein